MTARLSLPEAWATDSTRRTTAHVPPEVPFQTKPDLALALREQAQAWHIPFAVVVPDAGDGDPPTFLSGLAAREVAYVVGVSSTFEVRRPDEGRAAASVPPLRPRGRGQPKQPRPAPLYPAKTVLEALPADHWQTITWREHAGTILRRSISRGL